MLKHAITLLFLAPTFAQQSASDNPVFRVNSTLVQIDAVVTDSKGHQVPNLTANDFEIFADGVAQPITRFSYNSISSNLEPSQPFSKNPLLAAPPTIGIHRQDVRRTIVLMVDDLNLSFESLAFVRSSLLKFVDEQMQPGDLIAVCRTGAGTSVFQQFTADRRLARSIISSLRWNPNGSYGASFFEAINVTAQPFASPAASGIGTNFTNVKMPTVNGTPQTNTPQPAARTVEQVDQLRQNRLANGALGAIDYVVQALRDMPGRKSVILFSDALMLDAADSFTLESLHRLVDRANRSGTVIYTIHTTGLVTGQPSAADNPLLTGVAASKQLTTVERAKALETINNDRSEQLFKAQSGLEYLATLTGGLAYFNGNDLNFGLARVLEDQKGYYLLGYSPPADTFDAKQGELPYHKLKVVVKDKNLHVRSRTGFYGATDEDTKPRYANAIEEVRAAMLSPFASAGLNVRLTPIYSEVPHRGPVVRSLLDIDARDLTFQPLPDGSSEAKIKLIAAAYGPDNKQLKFYGSDYTLSIPPGKMDETLRDGVLYDLTIELPKPGGFQIRAAVRDEATGKMGSANEYIDVPDARKKQLALTSVILASAPRTGTNATSLGPSAAKRQFHHGEILQYFCLLENGDPKHIAAEDTLVQIRVVNEGKQIYLGPAQLTDLPSHQRAVMGQLRLGEQLPAGDYLFQVVAAVPKNRRNASASQWTDFEVLP